MINFVCPYCGAEIPVDTDVVFIPTVWIPTDVTTEYTLTTNNDPNVAYTVVYCD